MMWDTDQSVFDPLAPQKRLVNAVRAACGDDDTARAVLMTVAYHGNVIANERLLSHQWAGFFTSLHSVAAPLGGDRV